MTETKAPQTLMNRRAATGLIAAAAMAATAPQALAASKPAARQQLLRRGFNLPGWVTGETGTAPSPAVLDALRQAGFSSVRLPVDSDDWTGDSSRRRASAVRIGAALGQLTEAGFAVMLDFHPSADLAQALEQLPAETDAVIADAWRELGSLAAQFSPDAVFPELLNEPPLERGHWLDLRERLATTVRRTCPDHTLVWGANRYQGIGETIDFPLLADDNAIVAVHYYTPMGFTHQGADWDGSALSRLSNLPFPATRRSMAVEDLADSLSAAGDAEALALLETEFSEAWTVARINSHFQSLAEWAAQVDCPVILNEFGVLNFHVDPVSRGNWVRAVRQAAESHGFGWTYWELDQGFGFIANRQSLAGFDLAMIDALIVP